jgi:sulfur carrier protein
MTQRKLFWLNGSKYSVDQSITLLQLIEYFNYDNSLLVLEYNNKICNKMNWKNIYIQENDKLEIVTIVGGG